MFWELIQGRFSYADDVGMDREDVLEIICADRGDSSTKRCPRCKL